MPTPIHHEQPPWAWQDGFWLGGAAAVLAAVGATALAWWLATLAGWPTGLGGGWKWLNWSINSWISQPHISHLQALEGWWLIGLRVSSAGATALGAGLGLAAGIWIAKPGPGEQHITGRQLSDDPEEAAAEMAEECQISGEGLLIHPDVTISLDRETRHFLFPGSVGGGKTTTILPLMVQAIYRKGDKCLIYDNKGEFTAILPRAPRAKGMVLFAPWDKRCLAWDIASDCTNKADARTIAARLVPESEKDPMWGLAAQSILVAVFSKYQNEKPGKWDLQDVLNDVFAGYDHLRKIVMKYNKEGLYAVEDAQKTKTTQSFLITLSTFLSQVSDLAEAWKGKAKFSLRRWLLDPKSAEYSNSSCKYLILQGNKRYKKLEQAYIQSIIAALAAIVNSPELPDSIRRRLWLFFDEFPQLGKLPEMSQFMEIGRSKGCRVVLGCQDIAQIKDTYGRETAEAWASMVGTYLVCRSQGRETPRWLSELIGNRKVRRYRPSYSGDANNPTALNRTRQDSWEEVEEPVIRPDQITTSLGSRKNGIEALFFPGGETVYQLIWPYPQKKQLRPPVIPADWTKGPRPTPPTPTGDDQAGSEAGQGIEPQQAEQKSAAKQQPTDPQQKQQQPEQQPKSKPAFEQLEEQAEPEQHEEKSEAPERAAEELITKTTEHALDAVAPGAGAALAAVKTAAEVAETVQQVAGESKPQTQTAPVIQQPRQQMDDLEDLLGLDLEEEEI